MDLFTGIAGVLGTGLGMFSSYEEQKKRAELARKQQKAYQSQADRARARADERISDLSDQASGRLSNITSTMAMNPNNQQMLASLGSMYGSNIQQANISANQIRSSADQEAGRLESIANQLQPTGVNTGQVFASGIAGLSSGMEIGRGVKDIYNYDSSFAKKRDLLIGKVTDQLDNLLDNPEYYEDPNNINSILNFMSNYGGNNNG